MKSRLKWMGHAARLGEMINAYTFLVGKPEGKIAFRSCRSRWQDNIKMDLKEIGYCGFGLDSSGSG
jgi:hypothetical protein